VVPEAARTKAAGTGDAAQRDSEAKAIHGPSHPTARAALRHFRDIREPDAWEKESEHGAELETSLLLHLASEVVHMDEVEDFVPDAKTLRKYTRGRVPAPPPESRGVVGSPKRGTGEKGAAVSERYVREIAAALQCSATHAND
jgi:creatinine amidohydrolase/Fe(II)-dependent formamide hydrolase-like protein